MGIIQEGADARVIGVTCATTREEEMLEHPLQPESPRRRRISQTTFWLGDVGSDTEGSSGCALQIFDRPAVQSPPLNDGHPEDHVADDRFHPRPGSPHGWE